MDIITDPVIRMMECVIDDQKTRHILQTDLSPIHNLLLDITTLLQDQRKETQEILKIWLQLLHNCLTEAKRILDRSDPSQRYLACLMYNPGRPSKQLIKEWKVHFNYLFQALQTDFSNFVTAPQIVNRYPIPLTGAQESLSRSYDSLPNPNIKNCFLYCAMHRKDDEIYVEELVQIWIAEGLVRSKQGTHLMDMATGRNYVNLLVDRCLFQDVSDMEIENVWNLPRRRRSIRVNNTIRDMAIRMEENCVLEAGKELRDFPEIHSDDCRRISVSSNDIENLPEALKCPKLVSLFLSENRRIKQIPSGFLDSLTSLKVLDLSGNFRISSIPRSLGQLKQLQLLRFSYLSKIQDLPEEISNLSSLKFLDLSGCGNLQTLPSNIGELKNLKYLNLDGCYSLRVIPDQLTSLTTLDLNAVELSVEESEASIWRLKGFKNLTKLRIFVKVDVQEGISRSSGIQVGIFGTWSEMRHLCLEFIGRGNKDYVMDNLPQDMQSMGKLQSFFMHNYHGLSLPHYTCKFQNLEYLQLVGCPHLRELSPLERLPNLRFLKLQDWPNLKELGIGSFGRASGFLMLEKLVLGRLPILESIAGPSNNVVPNERTLSSFRTLKILDCPVLKRLPADMNKLLHLSEIIGENHWWQTIIWEDDIMKEHLQSLFTEWKPKWV